MTAKLGQPPLLDTGDISFETTLQWIWPPTKLQSQLPEPAASTEQPLTAKSELSLAACHSRLERSCAELLDQHPHVEAWARNFGLGWSVPYHFQGIWRSYFPDFVARLTGGAHLIIECKGLPDEKSEATKRYVTDWWIPAVAGTPDIPHRRWAFAELLQLSTISSRLDRVIANLLSGGSP